ncbi:MAG: Hpt domain-containing protein, partial [Acidobacteriota bacterium]|nr:Hpt domain-containing protein [Acidobacteriota bacterium]
ESQLQQLLDLDDGKTTLLCEMATMFRAEAPRRLAAIQEGLEAGDAAAVGEAAHALKGASGLMGAQAVFDLARDLEMKAKTGALPSSADLMELLSGLGDAVAHAQAGIDNFLSKARG